MNALSFLFGLDAPVRRKAYILTGFGLAALKYAIDATLVYTVTGKVWTLLAYLSPALIIRSDAVGPAPDSLLWGMAAYSLPFAWIGLSMSVRRAANAGWTPWLGVFFLVPVLNWLLIAALCWAPERAEWVKRDAEQVPLDLKNALLGIGVGVALTMSMVATSVFVLGQYGWSLFIGTPLVVGILAGYMTNRDGKRGVGVTLATALIAIGLSATATLLFAIEGIICIAMAAAPAAIVAMAGSLIGRAIAIATVARKGQDTRALIVLVAMLPLLGGAETLDESEPLYEVATTVEIDAPPEVVWDRVIHFSEMAPPPAWVQSTGIAYPIRAKLVGEGVGAVRHCEFSTGAFVEPITAWEPGRRLAFDVRSQPDPMKEWSPYTTIHPPHLDGYLRSRRGEFRLIELPGGRTRLEGSTWYTIDISPRSYWSMITNVLIHKIHERVLHHVRDEAQAMAGR